MFIVRDFHFLPECVVYQILWSTPAQPGSLCNLREIAQRTQVSKAVELFNAADEFLVHAFKNHLIASMLRELSIKMESEPIHHSISRQWLDDTATKIVSTTLMPSESVDPVFQWTSQLFTWHICTLT